MVDNFLNLLDSGWKRPAPPGLLLRGCRDVANITGVDAQGRYIISGLLREHLRRRQIDQHQLVGVAPQGRLQLRLLSLGPAGPDRRPSDGAAVLFPGECLSPLRLPVRPRGLGSDPLCRPSPAVLEGRRGRARRTLAALPARADRKARGLLAPFLRAEEPCLLDAPGGGVERLSDPAHVSTISNNLPLESLIAVIVESIVGYCITLLLSTLYGYYRRLPRIPRHPAHADDAGGVHGDLCGARRLHLLVHQDGPRRARGSA